MYNPYDTEKYPVRKKNRLQGYDYSSENYYFITICSHEKQCIFGSPEKKSLFGSIAEQAVQKMEQHYPDITVDKYEVMPNHVHFILYCSGNKSNVASVIGSYKSYVSREIHRYDPSCQVWQKSFHDHIIRNEKSYQNIWLYIENNPINWEKDCFYMK